MNEKELEPLSKHARDAHINRITTQRRAEQKIFINHSDNSDSKLFYYSHLERTQKKLCYGVQALPSEKRTPHMLEIRTSEGTAQKRRKTMKR